MTKLVFETNTIAEAVRKASRVAPTKGSAFDKASGIVWEMDFSHDPTVVVKATNLEVFYSEWVEALEVEGESAIWRFPSDLISGTLGSLIAKGQKHVTFEDKKNEIHMTCGRTKARFIKVDPEYYPVWDAFDPDELSTVQSFGTVLNQVDWACDKSAPPLNGIMLDGENAWGTDKYKLVRVDLKMDHDFQVVIPARTLAGILAKASEVRAMLTPDQLWIMPDDYTQIRTQLLAVDYPSVDRAANREQPNEIKFKKSQLVEIMNRALNFVGSDRFPTIRVFIGKEEVAVMMANQEIGLLGDVLSLPGQCVHDRIEFKFTPANLIDSIDNAPSDEVTLYYHADNGLAPLRVQADAYEAWVVPRREMSGGSV